MDDSDNSFARNWRGIASAFLKLGLTAYGGLAIMGIMQTELQEKRQWVSKERFVEGMALVNTLPGPGVIQLGIFLGYTRGGLWGGLLAGLCFMLPAFFIMLGLTVGYAAYGATPLLSSALYGLGPVVMGVFLIAVYRLAKSVVTTISQLNIAVAAAVVFGQNGLGPVELMAIAGGIGLWMSHSRRMGAIALGVVIAAIVMAHLASSAWVPAVSGAGVSTQPASLFNIGSFFFVVGAFSFGGGLSIIALIQEQVVQNYHWLTQREFIDGLALGQVTPGPILMVAAYVGYKLAGVSGAVIAGMAIFLPSFILMLSILPVFDRVRKLIWAKAALRGIGPAVIGVITVSLFRMAPYALPDPIAIVLLVCTVIALLAWRIGAIKLVFLGALAGVLRSRLPLAPAIRAML